jgi:hypothetical protein
MNKIFKIIVLLIIFVFMPLVFSDAFARSKELEGKENVRFTDLTYSGPYVQQRVHRVSDINACMTNWGFIGSGFGHPSYNLKESLGGCFNPHPDSEVTAPSFEFPVGSGLEYLFWGGIWIGAKINDTAYTSVGLDGWQGIHELWPDSFPQGAITERSTIPETTCHSPDAISNQDIIAVYTDTSADIPLSPQQIDPWDNRKHFPLDTKITQKSYSWDEEGYDDFIIAEYTIENIGGDTLSQVYIGFYMDTDIMHIDENPYGAYGAQDDITGFLHEIVYPGDTVNIAWAADNDGHGSEDGGASATVFTDKSPTSVFGMKVLNTPKPSMKFSYNWWISNSSGYPYDWGPWKAANQTKWAAMNPYGSGNLFPDNVLGTPGGDVSKYFIMSNGEIDYDQIYSCIWPNYYPEWLPVNQQMCTDLANGYDTRFLLSFGPFDSLYPGHSLHFAVAYIIGENFHTDPRNFAQNFNPNNPAVFYSHLNFSNLIENALTAQRLYDTLLGPTSVEEPEKEVPKSFYLSQNYPNPFNLSTIIKYSLKKTSYVSVKIYNIKGELVKTLVDQNQESGIHQKMWDGKDQRGKEVASGIYFYKLVAGDQSQIKKMILLK